ncbi:MAG: MFS transporter [Streptosporangiaceae bacterium]
MPTANARRVTFADVFAVHEFRALWISNVLSIIGDRLALVALTILVYERTHSPLLAAVAYAAGYIPWVIGGLLFARISDHRPRRAVMVTCDLIRVLLVAAMLVPGVSVAVLVGLLFATTMFAPPFEAARSAIVPDILEGERYVLGIAVIQTTFRTGIVLGAVAGGIAVALVGPRPALAIDAATFAASALAIGLGTKRRPAAARKPEDDNGPIAEVRSGFSLVFGNQGLRTLVLFGWLVTLYEVPEGIAAPYAAALHGGAVMTGLLIASGQVGAMLFTPYFTGHVGPRRRLRWMGPMAVLTCAVLVVAVMRPGLYMSMAIFAVSGTFGIYQIAANTAFVARVPNERRSQAFGVANAGLIVGQGILFLLAGAAAEKFPPAEVVAVCGGLGTVAAVILALRWRGISPVVGRHKARQAHSGGRRTRVPAPRPVLAAAALAAPVPVTHSPESHSPASHSSAKARQPYAPPKAPPLPMRRPAPVHARSRTGS